MKTNSKIEFNSKIPISLNGVFMALINSCSKKKKKGRVGSKFLDNFRNFLPHSHLGDIQYTHTHTHTHTHADGSETFSNEEMS